MFGVEFSTKQHKDIAPLQKKKTVHENVPEEDEPAPSLNVFFSVGCNARQSKFSGVNFLGSMTMAGKVQWWAKC